MKIPNSIKIGYRHYTVSFEEKILDADNTRLVGQINHNQLTIVLDQVDRHESCIREVLLHEVLHGCLDFAGINDDESFVIRMSEVIATVLSDNPEFVDLWRGDAAD
jgi:hypothetical protein